MVRFWARVPFLLLFSFAICGFNNAAAQDLPDVAQGLQPYSAYHGGQLDNVSIVNGGLTVRIPLVSYPQKGSSLSLSFSVILNSFSFQDLAICDAAEDPNGPIDEIPLRTGCTNTIQLTPTGIYGSYPLSPRLILDQQLQAGGNNAPIAIQGPQPPIGARFYVIEADNSEHPLAATPTGYRSMDESGYLFTPTNSPGTSNGNIGSPANQYPGDTSYRMNGAPGTIVDRHGNIYQATSITDRDGNAITWNSGTGNSQFPALPILDSANRTIPAPVPVAISNCPTLTGATFQPLSSAYQWVPPGSGPNGYIFCYASVNIYTHFFIGSLSGGNSEYRATPSMLQSIVLPNGQHWGFIYDSNDPSHTQDDDSVSGTGQLTSLIYPTGGVVNYGWTYGDGACNGARPNGLNPDGAAILVNAMQVTSRTMVDRDGTVLGTWKYGIGGVTSAANDLTVTTLGSDPNSPYVSCPSIDMGETYYSGPTATGTPLKSVTKTYEFDDSLNGPFASVPRETLETTTIYDTSTGAGYTSTVGMSYADTNFSDTTCDMNGNNCASGQSYLAPLGGPVLTTYTDYDGTTLKKEKITPQWQADGSGAYLAANLIDLSATTAVLDASGQSIASTTYSYDEGTYSQGGGTRGHITTTSQTLNTGPAPTTHTYWNPSGQNYCFVDANGNKNSYGCTTYHKYDQCYGSLVSDTYDALDHHTSGIYDCNSGLLTSLTDPNGSMTQMSWDAMRRPTQFTYPPIGQPTNPNTKFCYQDDQQCNASSPNTVVKTVAGAPDPDEITTVAFDGFGRETHRYMSDPQGQDGIDTTYDPDGRVYTVTNPYRSTGDSTYGLTTTSYDALNRKLSQQQPDGTPLTWQYKGPTVDSYDEAGVHHQHTSDALGRLISVMELGTVSSQLNLQTNYSYDPLGNLQSVVQHGTATETQRTRSFTYDSLSRLVCSANPETNTITNNPSVVCPLKPGSYPVLATTYTYDANGNVLSKADANSYTTGYSYDPLNRIASRQTNDGVTRAQFYHYDWTGGPNGIGRLLQTTDNFHVASGFQYDALGHLIFKWDCLETDCSYSDIQKATYDLAGNVTSFQYPDGRIVNQTWDSAGHLSTVSDATPNGSGTTYFGGDNGTGARYFPSGALANAVYGNGVSESSSLNSRLQPCRMIASWSSGGTTTSLIDRQSYYNPSTSSPCGVEANNNGNIYSIVDNLQVGLTQAFSYDGLSRLTSGSRSDGAYNHTYNYDSFGNMVVQDNLAHNSVVYSIDPYTNRLLRSHDGGVTSDYTYDPTGTLTRSSDGIGPSHMYQHNPQGQLLFVDGGVTASYLYGGMDERVFKQTPSGTTDYVYFNGQPIAEKDQSGNWTDYIYANGQKIARTASQDSYLQVSGNAGNGGYWHWDDLTAWHGYQIQPGDRLNWRQYGSSTARGGMRVVTDKGGDSSWTINDSNGQPSNESSNSGQWEFRTIDLSSLQGGKITLLAFGLAKDTTGQASLSFADIVILSADGTVRTVFNGQSVGFTPWSSNNGMPSGAGVFTTSAPAGSSLLTNQAAGTHYYLDDHLGSTQMELSSGGWPVWSGQFTPFGQEIVGGQVLSANLGNQSPGDGTSMHYKFTGKERDSESGLDYFGARYYASNVGRWISADWAQKPEAVPYSKLDDPQSLNLYEYVGNNPLSKADADGHQSYSDTISVPVLSLNPLSQESIHFLARQTQSAIDTAVANVKANNAYIGTFISAVLKGEKPAVPAAPGVPTGVAGGPTAAGSTSTTGATPAAPTGSSGTQPRSNPMTGTPGSTSQTTQPNGSPKQVRRYGADGYPEVDVDHGHDHGQGDPHAHDWGRPAGGGPPTAEDRGTGRPLKPSDPKAQ